MIIAENAQKFVEIDDYLFDKNMMLDSSNNDVRVAFKKAMQIRRESTDYDDIVEGTLRFSLLGDDIGVKFQIPQKETQIYMFEKIKQNEEKFVETTRVSHYPLLWLCSKFKIPKKYIDFCMQSKDSEKREIAVMNLNEWVKHSQEKLKVRKIGNDNKGYRVRAILSSSYGIYDNWRVLYSLRNKMKNNGFTLASSYLDEDMMILRFLENKVIYVPKMNCPNEHYKVRLGLQIRNSEVGIGSLSFAIIVNIDDSDMIMEHYKRKNHVCRKDTAKSIENFDIRATIDDFIEAKDTLRDRVVSEINDDEITYEDIQKFMGGQLKTLLRKEDFEFVFAFADGKENLTKIELVKQILRKMPDYQYTTRWYIEKSMGNFLYGGRTDKQ